MSIGIGTNDVAPEAHATVTQTYSGKQTMKLVKDSFDEVYIKGNDVIMSSNEIYDPCEERGEDRP